MIGMRATDIVRQRRARPAGRRALRAPRALAGAALLPALLVMVVLVAGLAGGAAALLVLTRDLPAVETLRDLPGRFRPITATTRLYAGEEPATAGASGRVLIDEISDPRQDSAGWVVLDDLPPVVPAAYLAVVDPQFMSAAPSTFDALRGALTSRDSPVIQELIRDHLRGGAAESPGDTRRAWQDWLLARQMERLYSREQLLEWTLNTRYFGHLAYGIEAAAWVYFAKGAADLTPGEAALLVAVARDPAANPFDDPAGARRGQEAALTALVAAGTMTADAAATALQTPVALAPPPGSTSATPDFARMARRELERSLGPERLLAGGWQVETTLDWALQTQATCLIAAHAARSGPATASGGGPACPAAELLPATGDPPAGAAAIVALDPATGAITALAGDVTTAHPGGALVRPLIYLTALSRGYTAATLTLDVPIVYLQAGRPYTPRNADGQYLGPLRLRQALAADRAAPAAQVLGWVGPERVLATARALGLRADAAAAGLTLAEEGFPAGLLATSAALAAVANRGAAAGAADTIGWPRPTTIRRVTDGGGAVAYAFEPITREALAPELAYLLTDILAGRAAACPAEVCPATPELPDGRRAALVAGDGWAVGSTPERLIGVWAGDGAPPAGDNAAGAAALWRALMGWATAGTAAGDWARPAGLRPVEVCAASGLLPSRAADCPTIREWFAPGTEPSAVDTMTREVAVNRETGRLATIFTPPQLVERRVVTDYPPEAAGWAMAQGIDTPPAEFDTIRHVPTSAGGAAVSSPEPWAVVSGQWSVVGSAGGEGFSTNRLAYFPGLWPEAMGISAEGSGPVRAGELGVWDTTLVEDGLYTVLLTVFRSDGTFDEVAIPVTVANGGR